MRATYSQDQITKLKSISRLIGDTNSLLIIYELMMFGEKSFNELKRMTEINQVTLSKKLSILKSEGVVDSYRTGNENRYFITNKADDLEPLIKNIEKLIINKER